MDRAPRQKVVEQAAANAQTVQFVADQATEIADAADELAKQKPEFSAVAAAERGHRSILVEMAREEKRLATAVQFREQDPGALAASVREHRKDLMEIAREEGRLSGDLLSRIEEIPETAAMADQAGRNQEILQRVASAERKSDGTLRTKTPRE